MSDPLEGLETWAPARYAPVPCMRIVRRPSLGDWLQAKPVATLIGQLKEKVAALEQINSDQFREINDSAGWKQEKADLESSLRSLRDVVRSSCEGEGMTGHCRKRLQQALRSSTPPPPSPDPAETLEQVREELTEAIRLTVEYTTTKMLPPIDGWSWFDAMKKYAPEKLPPFFEEWERLKPRASEEGPECSYAPGCSGRWGGCQRLDLFTGPTDGDCTLPRAAEEGGSDG